MVIMPRKYKKSRAAIQVIGTYKEFRRFIPRGKKRELDPILGNAVETYLRYGGVLKMEDAWPPMFVYPSKARLEEQMHETERKQKYIGDQVIHWKKELKSMDSNVLMDGVRKFTDTLYWKHLIKTRTDSSYRKAVKVVDPPIDMMKDPKYRKMMGLFLNSPEYRDRLIEARTSALGKKRSSIKESAHRTVDSKYFAIESRITKLEKEKQVFDEKCNAHRVLLNYTTRMH